MSDLAATIVGGLVFFALILVSVGLHEVGHFVPGKLFRVKVLQFFIGFGKNLWSTRRGETEYGIKLVPLGGYVRLLGMYPPKVPGKDTRLKRLADSAREAEWEEITDSDIDNQRLFYQKPLWQRLIIMFSGVGINLLLAFALFLGVNLGYGQPQPSLRVAVVQQCVDPSANPCVETPAFAMGLAVDDVIVAFNGTEYETWEDLLATIQANGDGPVQLSVLRWGSRMELPEVKGLARVVEDPDDPGVSRDVGYLGISSQTILARVGPVETLGQMWEMTTQAVGAIIALPVTAVVTVRDMVTGQPRDVNSPISIVGASVLAGDVAAIDAPFAARAAVYVQLLASINLFVGVMNLIPLPPFDGGQVAAGIFEALRRGWAKLRGRPDPGPADTAKLLPVTYVVGGLLLVIGAILIIADIVNPVAVF